MELKNTNAYDVTDLTSLEKLEPVRIRPGMYIGSTGSKGLHHCIWEIIDNSIDEIANGYGNKVTITLNEDKSVTVLDNGRGIPTGIHPIKKKSGVEMVFTELHTGGKFDNKNYKTSGGLHGVGAAVVNALSEWLEVEVYQNGNIYRQRFEYAFDKELKREMPGTSVGSLKVIGKTDKVGTKITFKPDKEIFSTTDFKFDIIDSRLQELAFQNKGIRLELIDKRKGQEITKEYYSENGLLDFINYLNESKTPIHEEPIIFDGERTVGELQLYGEVCIQFTDSTTEYIASYVNNIPTTEAGTHETGFKTGMTRSFKEWSKKLGLVKEKDKEFEGDDLREGMTAIVRIKITNPIFEGQTKTKLGNNEAYTMMNDLVYTKFSEWIEDNKTLATSIINNALEAAKRRDKIKKINEAEKKKIGKGTAPLAGKVAVCTLKDKTVNEFIVVEGDSAGGSAKQARDRRFQTIMPSKGKIMNTEKQKLENVLASEELKIFNTAVGTGTLDNYREEDLKYDKIIIMSDADVDGYHIRTLWMTYIYRYMRPLIANGHLYLAQPPLYKVYRETKGKTIVKYAYSDDELENTKKQVGKGALIQRYKGLGEMNPDQLWDTTLNPESRTLLQVTIEDAAKAEKMVSLLMGDIVEPRKNYMYKYGEF
ncbi:MULTISPECIES: DNA gyrase/topoisomerase IV subunit B [Clostridium]|jgi:DNA topoisomerase IV subunit B (EC 5.99.1.3)|uniref:DNA topoisomerase (ATP-hydrolyzing) n=4 Tax=Clostridium TaxID=1485 RepID=A0A0B5QKB6_CLOBE|nr:MULTISPECIES: DNA topoisomerase IV subunit B [Clostridium]ABR36434.1 DNA topoisomerase (ATP-hydrolyzing) [Clostridium beijerinckii NCIMB 8052]AIU00646.1 DNA topoisomerase IV subunit B [Clostridium beijerinckii ATCC 35702]AJH01376.1 DNA topoisomerase IV subunit B [Clostridium beijerinckii]ALB44495.1 type IIA DNA topoisomerase subunit B [Clostridium beijerinckii NRRL B-598]AVK48308.1 DNA topoisomerase IV subunit B [Clostridium sp. MF28]